MQGTRFAGGSFLSEGTLRGSGQSQAFCLDLFARVDLNAWSEGLYEDCMHIHANHMQITPPPDQLEEQSQPHPSSPRGGLGRVSVMEQLGSWRARKGLIICTHVRWETKARGRDRLAEVTGLSRQSWVGSPRPGLPPFFWRGNPGSHLQGPSRRGPEFSAGGRCLC